MLSTGTYDLDVKRDRLTGGATSVAGSPNGALFELLNSSGRRPSDGPALDPALTRTRSDRLHADPRHRRRRRANVTAPTFRPSLSPPSQWPEHEGPRR